MSLLWYSVGIQAVLCAPIYQAISHYNSMKKLVSSAFVLSAFLVAPAAFAQSFYQYQPVYTAGCVTITQTLSLGSSDSYTGGQVSALQRFLVTAGYLNASDVVGYFGKATSAAVKRFQKAQNVPVSGVVGELTRGAVQRVSCSGAYGTPYTYTPPTYVAPTYVAPSYNTYPYLTCGTGYGYASCAQPLLATLSYIHPMSGAVGSSVTVFGSGFSATGNTVHFGNGIITNLNSPDGLSVSFTVPSQLTGYGSQAVTLGTYPVSVTNAYGSTSGTASFTVTSLGTSATPTISNLTGPTTLGTGVQGVWSFTVTPRSGASYYTASVSWGDESTYPYAYGAQTSQQLPYGTQTVSFTHAYLTAGTYTITFTVRDSNGAQSIATMTVTVSGSSTYGAPTITSVSPSSARVGTQVVIYGSGFTPTGNTVRFGNGGMQNVTAQNGTMILYTIPYATSPCDVLGGYMCAASAQLITPGTYPLFVTNGNGTSGTVYFTVLP